MQGRKGANTTHRQAVRLGLLLVSLLWGSWLMAQEAENSPREVNATLTTSEEYIEVGRPFKVDLEVVHPSDMVVILPDTGQDFAPYELAGRAPAPTRSSDGRSVDFVTYSLRSWSIDSIQEIRFPVQYIQSGDTKTVYSSSDSVILMPAITTPIDSLDVMTNDLLADVEEPIDWRATILLFGIPIVLLIIALVVFWKPMLRFFKGRRLERQYQKFNARLDQSRQLLPDQKEYLLIVSRIWKDYLDTELKMGLASFSSRELRTHLGKMDVLPAGRKEALLEMNQSADRVTYAGAGIESTKLDAYYSLVGQVLKEEFARRKEALKK